MVNAHCHLELSHMRGALEDGGGFAEFARGMAASRHDFPRHYIALQAAVEDARLWAEGVGVVGDICNSTDTFGIKRESGIEYMNFLELFGLQRSSAEELIPLAEVSLAAGLKYTITPHSTYSLSDEAFSAAVRGVNESTAQHYRQDYEIDERKRPPLSVHFMESPQESEMFEEYGALWDWNIEQGARLPFTKLYGSPTDRIIALVPPERNVMLVHNCCVTEEDIDRIHDHFTGRVTWVLCPRSNDFISGIAPPVEMMRRKGANIAVGTDSLASNRKLSMAEELKCFKSVPVEEALGWATEGGSDALCFGNGRGRFEVGQRTGVVCVTGVDMNKMEITDALGTERIL